MRSRALKGFEVHLGSVGLIVVESVRHRKVICGVLVLGPCPYRRR